MVPKLWHTCSLIQLTSACNLPVSGAKDLSNMWRGQVTAQKLQFTVAVLWSVKEVGGGGWKDFGRISRDDKAGVRSFSQ